jgi:uroporphyrinogen decarboxylase
MTPDATVDSGATRPSPFLAAARGERPWRTPVWFMRQAGRSLPEYRALRGTGSILEAIAQPEIAAEVTLQPVRRYGVDAAVLFSDIVVPVHAIGFGIDVVPGRGPVAERPFAAATDLDRLRPLEASEDIPYVIETVRMLANELDPATCPLLGFAGAPFTVASYLVEGGPSKTFTKVKALMHTDPVLWAALVDRLADLAIAFVTAQVEAGAAAVQLFDSWAGSLSPAEYRRFALPATRKVMAAVGELGVPRIIFGVGTGELLGDMATSGADVVGVDWRVPLDDAARRIGPMPVQGNLDPALCFAPFDVVAEEARDVLRRGAAAPGHIFNLGHGVLPETDPGVLAAVTELVHAEGLDRRDEGVPQ